MLFVLIILGISWVGKKERIPTVLSSRNPRYLLLSLSAAKVSLFSEPTKFLTKILSFAQDQVFATEIENSLFSPQK